MYSDSLNHKNYNTNKKNNQRRGLSVNEEESKNEDDFDHENFME
ncbi:MAG: hypothetical protein ACK5NI_02090 [bacterium]